MWFAMRSENLAFLDRAPVVHVTEGGVPAPREAVFAALADARGWKHWFPNVRAASYKSPAPYGVGTIREANVGGTRWVEEMVAWDEGVRFAWTVTGASVPFANALVESYELADAPGGTLLRWTFALEPRLLARLGAPFTAGTLRNVLRQATENLGTRLRAASA